MQQFLFTEIYRPKIVDECILPERIKEFFHGFIKAGEIPNLILNGKPGVGKTSIAVALLEEMGREYIKINGSLRNGIDAVRNDITDFASSISFDGGRKYIILDEGDGLNHTAQDALKSFIEEFASNTGFIITCNDKDRLNEAILSRFSVIEFDFKQEDFTPIANQFFVRLKEILDKENITYEPKALAHVIRTNYPDWRKVLNQIQTYAQKNKTIDSGIISRTLEEELIPLIVLLKNKAWKDLQVWVATNPVSNFPIFGRTLFKILQEKTREGCHSNYAICFNEHDYKMAFVMDKETNILAFLTNVMTLLEWK